MDLNCCVEDWGYIDNINAHMYIISFEKLLSDAIKRNKIFFDKLGIAEPTKN
jgi:hypothetical protein